MRTSARKTLLSTAVLAAAVLLSARSSRAGENKYLDAIPQEASRPERSEAKAPPTLPPSPGRLYLENAFTVSSNREGLVVPLPKDFEPFRWQERLLLDLRKEWDWRDFGFAVSNRLNLRAENDLEIPSRENVINEFREAYVSWRPYEGIFLDVGRINLKSGVALGYNPTDFFKTRAVEMPLTTDPTVLREDRLGTVMIRGQYLWDGGGRWPAGSISASFAPDFENPGRIDTNTQLPSFSPQFDRTNAHNRFLLKGSVNLASGFSPELLVYREGSRTLLGANLTAAVGQGIVAYAEWSGGRRPSLIHDAVHFGRETGTLPENAPSALPEDSHESFQNELAIGASYTTGKITVNLEYHFNQTGFSRRDWSNWFAVGGGAGSSSQVIDGLWYIRQYAIDQREQISRHALFLRADWVDAFVPHLELTGFIKDDLYDGSALIHASADYDFADAWRIGVQVEATVGGRRSDFGSLPQRASVLIGVRRYF